MIPLLPLNIWRHVVVTAKSGESKLLIDGVQHGETNTLEFNHVTQADELFIAKGHNNERHFKGKIGNLQIFHGTHEHERIHDEIYNFLDEKPSLNDAGIPPVVEPKSTSYGYKSSHGKYMSAQPDGRMECNRDQLRGWETFTIENTDDGKIVLKSAHGKYLSAQPDGRLEVNRDAIGSWERFSVEEIDGKVGFKSHHGKYISALSNGTIVCNRDALRDWELFVKESV